MDSLKIPIVLLGVDANVAERVTSVKGSMIDVDGGRPCFQGGRPGAREGAAVENRAKPAVKEHEIVKHIVFN